MGLLICLVIAMLGVYLVLGNSVTLGMRISVSILQEQ